MQLVDFDVGYDVVLSSSECQEIIDFYKDKKQHEREAATRQEGVIKSDYNEATRAGKVNFWHNSEFPYERDIKDAIYRYCNLTDIVIYEEDPGLPNVGWQFSIYDKVGDHFNEHQDQSVSHFTNKFFYNNTHKNEGVKDQTMRSYRKVSASIQLSNPNDYEGCALQIRDKRDSMFALPRTQGSVLVFPSYAQHVVTPLTSGTRYAMVGWFYGPLWR